MTDGDKQVVSNIRNQYKEKVSKYTDEYIAKTWREFSGSEDYPDDGVKFLEWLEMGE